MSAAVRPCCCTSCCTELTLRCRLGRRSTSGRDDCLCHLNVRTGRYCACMALGPPTRHADWSKDDACDISRDNITAMATPEDWAIIRDALSPLCEPLYRCADRSQELADDHFIQHGMHDTEHPGGRAHLARHHLRHELKKENNLSGWKIGCPRPNGEVTLSLSTMNLRMLRPGPKLFDAFPSPSPGRNRARVLYYKNPKLNLFGASGSNLVGVWAIDPDLEEIAIRVVRPIRAWRFGQDEQIDIDFFLPRQGTALDTMEFIPSDEGMFLPMLEDLEEGEEDADSTDG